jgi:hypothetical protein
LSGYATGIPFGSLTYGAPYYVGTNALALTASGSQYIQIPYVNLTQSFTIQAWLYPSNPVVAEYGIFSQCDSNSNCLLISLRNSRFVFSLDSMNTNNYTLTGSSIIPLNDWIHLTVVYDAVLYQKQIYVNGLIDAVSKGIIQPYQGTSSGSTTTIGRSVSFAYGSSYFEG